MNNEHEVISAFVDDEPFDPHELAAALSEPGGRTLMLDLIELGRIVQPDNIPAISPHRRLWRPIALAAAPGPGPGRRIRRRRAPSRVGDF